MIIDPIGSIVLGSKLPKMVHGPIRPRYSAVSTTPLALCGATRDAMRARRYRGEYREVAGAIAMRSKLTTLEFNLSIDDYAEFSVYYTLHSRFGRKLGGWLLVSSIGPVAVLLSLALGIYPHLYEQAGGVLGLIFFGYRSQRNGRHAFVDNTAFPYAVYSATPLQGWDF
jgi:hypothetical protein